MHPISGHKTTRKEKIIDDKYNSWKYQKNQNNFC